MRAMRACACGECRMRACSRAGQLDVVHEGAAAGRQLDASTRRSDRPTVVSFTPVVLGRRRRPPPRAHGLDRLDVARAAAEAPGQRVADLASVGSGTASSSAFAHSSMAGVQYPHWTAPVSTNACCTGCSASGVPRPFDRLDLAALRAHREREARHDRPAVEQHRAGAALAGLAAVLHAPEALAAQQVEQRRARLGLRPAASRR